MGKINENACFDQKLFKAAFLDELFGQTACLFWETPFKHRKETENILHKSIMSDHDERDVCFFHANLLPLWLLICMSVTLAASGTSDPVGAVVWSLQVRPAMIGRPISLSDLVPVPSSVRIKSCSTPAYTAITSRRHGWIVTDDACCW